MNSDKAFSLSFLDPSQAGSASLQGLSDLPFLNAISEGIVVHNRDGEIVLCNEAALNITGLTKDQMMDREFMEKHWNIQTGQPQKDIVMSVVNDDKTTTWINVNSYPVMDATSEEVNLTVTSFSDITAKIRMEDELRQSEQRWKSVLNTSKSGIFLVNDQFDLELVNEQGKRMLQLIGADLDVSPTVSFIDKLPAERREPVRDTIRKVLKGERVEYEILYKKINGADLWLVVNYGPVKEVDGSINAVCITASNITAIKKKETALLKSEQRWKFALEGAGDGVWEYNYKTRESYYSPIYKMMLGFTDEEFKNDVLEWRTRLHPEDIIRINEIDDLYENGSIDHHSVEYRILNKANEYMWVLDRGMVLERNPDGSILKLIGTHKDINERKIAEDSLSESQQRFTSFMANTPTMTWIIDEHAVFRYLNESYKRSFQLTDQHVGLSIHEIFPPEICQGFITNNWKVWESGNPIETVEEGVGPDGNQQFYHIFKFPLESQNGVRLLGGVALDITKKIQVERHLSEEENKKKREIIQAIIDAQEKERKELAYELHDNVNQILTSSKLMLEVAAEKPDLSPEFIRRSLSYLNEAIVEIRNISHSLTPGTLNDISLDAAIGELVQTINSTGKIKIIYHNLADQRENQIPPEIQLCALRITQEQLNNILKHAKATEAIVTLDINYDRLSIAIRDNGIGFDPATTKKGLGLNNIFNRVEYHHGYIKLNTSQDNGCILYIEFPIRIS